MSSEKRDDINERVHAILSRALAECLSVRDDVTNTESPIGMAGKMLMIAEMHGVDGDPYVFSVYSPMNNWDAIGLLETENERLRFQMRMGWATTHEWDLTEDDDDESPY